MYTNLDVPPHHWGCVLACTSTKLDSNSCLTWLFCWLLLPIQQRDCVVFPLIHTFFPPVTIIFSVVLKKWWISAELDLNWDWRKIIRGLYFSVTLFYSCKYTGKTNNLYWRALTFKPWCTADQIADLSQIKFSHGRVATLWWKQSQCLRFSNF